MSRALAFLLPFAALVQFAKADCLAYSLDFQSEQPYFINSLDSSNFTSSWYFTGCSPEDQMYYELTGPDGNLVECSNTPETPDGTVYTTTCEIAKNAMMTGNNEWVLTVASNNGDGNATTAPPFSGQVVFYLDVDPQQTVTSTPTVVVPVTVTPTVNSTAVSTYTSTISAAPVTITQTIKPVGKQTITVYPPRVTTTTTAISSYTRTSWVYTKTVVTSTKTATCTLPPKPKPVKPATGIYLQNILARLPSTNSAASKRDVVALRDRSVERAVLQRRGADEPTTVVIDTDSAHWPVLTSTITAPTVTNIVFATTTVDSTITPAPFTVLVSATRTTITAKASTRTVTIRSYTTTKVTKTVTATVTIKTIATPSASASSCHARGGTI